MHHWPGGARSSHKGNGFVSFQLTPYFEPNEDLDRSAWYGSPPKPTPFQVSYPHDYNHSEIMVKQNNSHFVQLTVFGCKDLIWRKKDLLKGPLILPSYFLFLLWCEVILDVEGFANLLRGLALDHISHGLACQIQQVLNVQVICCLLCTTPKFM